LQGLGSSWFSYFYYLRKPARLQRFRRKLAYAPEQDKFSLRQFDRELRAVGELDHDPAVHHLCTIVGLVDVEAQAVDPV
jgi:hypothetical protein